MAATRERAKKNENVIVVVVVECVMHGQNVMIVVWNVE